MFSPEEKNRYSRQIRLDVFGEASQVKLNNAHVFVVGAGALGCPVLSYLVGAGVGKLTIVDGDIVELSNLHRQVLYATHHIGQYKAEVAKRVLSEKNTDIEIVAFSTFLSNENIHELAQEADILVDGTDNFPTRYLVNDYCVLNDKVNVHGSIQQFEGQVSVFNALQVGGMRGPNYRDLFPRPPRPDEVFSCAEGGVIGALPGIIGSMMAMECIKLITGLGEVLSGKLWQIDTLQGHSRVIQFTADELNPINGKQPTIKDLIDYDEFCGVKQNKMKSVSCEELHEMMVNREDFQLIDVREVFEFEEANMGGELIPLGELPNRIAEVRTDKKVVIHCKMGGRSANAIAFLEQSKGLTNLYNLDGGILAWLAFKKR